MSTFPQFWWWVGITDPRQPKGKQAIGAIVVAATEEAQALLHAKAILGREYAHCSLLCGQMAQEHGGPPPGWAGRFLGPKQADMLIRDWFPGGRLATDEEVRAAIMDDDARPGDPFGRKK